MGRSNDRLRVWILFWAALASLERTSRVLRYRMWNVARYLIIVVPLLILGLIALLWFLGQPSRYRRRVADDLSKFFETLLLSVYKTGFLIIEAPGGEPFIQFKRYETHGKSGIRFDFPLAPWSEHYYDVLNKILYEQGVDYETSTTRQDTVVSFITVDFKQDWVKARDLAKMVLLDVFELKPEQRIKIIFGK